MKVVIVEDEVLAQKELSRLLVKNFPAVEIEACLASVAAATQWFSQNTPDLVFMDIHLSDGLCFDIFKRVDVVAPVIFVTAYDQYAIKAFKVNSVDYLLKPLDEVELGNAMNKFMNMKQNKASNGTTVQIERLLKAYDHTYKGRFTVKLGDHVLFFETKDIAYFYSEDKTVYLMTSAGKKYPMDNTSLNALEEVLDPKDFFRLSRNCMTSIRAIKNVTKHFSSRLKVTLTPDFNEELLVSRLRVPEFLRWLDGEIVNC